MPDAAQEFLDKQLSKNRFTSKQQERLDASGGSAVVNASNGVVPGGSAYAKYGKMPKGDTKSTSDYMNVGSGDVRTGDFQDSNNNGTDDRDETTSDKPTTAPAATYAKGKMSAEDVRNKFGFSYNEEHAKNAGGYSKYGGRDDGAIYNQKTGEYVGTIDNFTKRGEDDAQGISQFESIQDHELEHGFRSSKRTDWDSMNDVAGAVQNLLGEKQAAAAPTEPEKERTPIEHSPEIKQATERVRAYEDNIMSGKTSENIFGSYDTGLNLATATEQSTNNGDAGIGTGASGSPAEAPAKAADSFLDSKKTDIKKDYSFKPKSGKITYGDN